MISKLASYAAAVVVMASAHTAASDKITPAIVASHSAHKIVVLDKDLDILMLGSSFFAKLDDGRVVGVTNNHICQEVVGHESYIRLVDEPNNIDYRNTKNALRINQVSFSVGDDVCFFTVAGKITDALDIGTDLPKLSKVTVVGYPGEYFNVIAIDGYTSSATKVKEFVGFGKCTPPYRTKMDSVMCNVMRSTAEYKETDLINITPNIGPGFSGSPVVGEDGKIIGMIARYHPPNMEYTNGHGMMIPISKIRTLSKKIEFLPVNDKKVKAYGHLTKFIEVMFEYFDAQKRQDDSFIKMMIKETLDEDNGS